MAHPRKQATRWLSPAQPQPARDSPQGDWLQSTPLAAVPTPPASPAPTSLSLISEAQELWLALYLPTLWLNAALRLRQADGPVVVLAPHSRVQRVLVADAAARDLGITAGLSLSSALALCPTLDARERDLRAERALLEQLAVDALRFTPRVSLERPDALLLEVKGSLHLFGGAPALCAAVQQSCATRAVPVQWALAPTPLAALAGARAGRALLVTHQAQLVGELANLPLSALRWPGEQLERLASMGVHTIGQVLRLPRAGFARRFGKMPRLLLDQLVGQRADPRAGFVTRERFAARCEPSYELTDHAAILQYCEPLLADQERFLRARQAGITSLLLRFAHRRPNWLATGLASERLITPLWVRLVDPELAAERFLSLLREHLARLTLPGPVLRIELRSGRLLPFAPCTQSLWQPGEYGGATGSESPAFIERLRARLGPDAVYSLCLVPEHRPEAAWRVAEPRPPDQTPGKILQPNKCEDGYLRRPLWLLREPQSLALQHDAPATAGLTLLGGPERIESGWWDGHDIARDYYLARNAQGVELWVFRERLAPHRWYLHGVFG